MGASGWRYYTPYRADPEAALQELRQRVFAEGDYSIGSGGFTKVNGQGPFDGVGPFPGLAPGFDPLAGVRAFAEQRPELNRLLRAAESGDYRGLSGEDRLAAEKFWALLTMFPRPDQGPLPRPPDAAPGDRPGSIEELLATAAEDGTHSVLDIVRTGRLRGFGVATPLPARGGQRVFGTTRPSHEQVEASWLVVTERLDRWQAHYLAVYRGGEPVEYAFIGCSGG